MRLRTDPEGGAPCGRGWEGVADDGSSPCSISSTHEGCEETKDTPESIKKTEPRYKTAGGEASWTSPVLNTVHGVSLVTGCGERREPVQGEGRGLRIAGCWLSEDSLVSSLPEERGCCSQSSQGEHFLIHLGSKQFKRR